MTREHKKLAITLPPKPHENISFPWEVGHRVSEGNLMCRVILIEGCLFFGRTRQNEMKP